MSEVKAIAKGIRISPRKVAVVADLVRRRSVADALVILEHTERKSAQPIVKVINSAVANARHNLRMSNDELQTLRVETIMVTDGGAFKRYAFVGTGRRTRPRPMLKRSSHVTVVLATPEVEVKKKDTKAPAKPATKAAEIRSEAKTASTSDKTTKSPVKKAPAKKPAAKKEVKK